MAKPKKKRNSHLPFITCPHGSDCGSFKQGVGFASHLRHAHGITGREAYLAAVANAGNSNKNSASPAKAVKKATSKKATNGHAEALAFTGKLGDALLREIRTCEDRLLLLNTALANVNDAFVLISE